MESEIYAQYSANDLRKRGRYLDALEKYKARWNNGEGNEYDAAGILYCLRKLKLLKEGLVFASSIPSDYLYHNWINIEISWTIADKVEYLSERGVPLENIDLEGEKVLRYNAADPAVNKIAFAIMKSAKENKNWDLLLKWVNTVNPASLNKEELILPDGKKGWSYLGRWANYKIIALIETGSVDESIQICKWAIDNFPNHTKFFGYNLFRAYSRLGDYEKAENAFNDLRMITKPDYYMFHEYGLMLIKSGRIDEGIYYLVKSVTGNQKPEFLVGYYADLGDVFRNIGKVNEARANYLLAAVVRAKNKWTIPQTLQKSLEDMQVDYFDGNAEELHSVCNDYWMKYLDAGNEFKREIPKEEPIETDIVGIIYLGPGDRKHFFVNPPGSEGIIGFKNELTEDIKDRCPVIFDVAPSFNKKRGEWSKKAVNVRLN